MFNSMKPTRLWHYTGIKHFRNMLNKRLTANPDRVYNQRHRNDLLMFFGLVMSAVTGVAYSFGVFSPPRDCNKVAKEAAAAAEKNCVTKPCPELPPRPKSKPCPPSDD